MSWYIAVGGGGGESIRRWRDGGADPEAREASRDPPGRPEAPAEPRWPAARRSARRARSTLGAGRSSRGTATARRHRHQTQTPRRPSASQGWRLSRLLCRERRSSPIRRSARSARGEAGPRPSLATPAARSRHMTSRVTASRYFVASCTISWRTALAFRSVCRDPRDFSHAGLSSSSRIRARAASAATVRPRTTRAGSRLTSKASGPDGLSAVRRIVAGTEAVPNP